MKKALVCIGNECRGDDGASFFVGTLVKENLKEWNVFFVGDEPESEFKALEEFKPDLIFVVDVLSGLNHDKPLFFDLSSYDDYVHLRHKLPNAILLSYFRRICPKTLFLGIRVLFDDVMHFSKGLSQRAKNDAKVAYEKILEIDTNLKEIKC